MPLEALLQMDHLQCKNQGPSECDIHWRDWKAKNYSPGFRRSLAVLRRMLHNADMSDHFNHRQQLWQGRSGISRDSFACLSCPQYPIATDLSWSGCDMRQGGRHRHHSRHRHHRSRLRSHRRRRRMGDRRLPPGGLHQRPRPDNSSKQNVQ